MGLYPCVSDHSQEFTDLIKCHLTPEGLGPDVGQESEPGVMVLG